jgi:hypothetical protein
MDGGDCFCPYCKYEMNVRQGWDYQQEFTVICDACHNPVCINVESHPEFVASKPTCAKCQKVKPLNGRGYCANCQEFLRAQSGEVLKEIRSGK